MEIHIHTFVTSSGRTRRRFGRSTEQSVSAYSQVFFDVTETKVNGILIVSFRLIPSFGPSTIRRFTDNTAAMKKLAARDFEDILQVSVQYRTNFLSVFTCCSAPCLYLRISCRENTTKSSWIFCSSWRPGMHTRSFACIQSRLCGSSIRQRVNLGGKFGYSKRLPALSMTPGSYLRKWLHEGVARQPKSRNRMS